MLITVRFRGLTAASVKTIVLWDVALCKLVEVGRRFRGVYTALYRRRLSSSLTCLQEPTTGLYSAAAQSSPHTPSH
jgi:hypothetical protein